MGISIDPTLPDRDWSGLVKPSLEAIAKLIAKDYFGAAFKAHDASKELRTKEETLEQRVWTLWRESLTIALPEFFKTAALTRQPDDEELKRLLVEVLEESTSLAKKDGAELTAEDLRFPLQFQLYQNVREKLPVWARKVAPEHLRDDDHLRRRLDRAFVKGFHRARFEGGSHFDEIRDYLFGDGAEVIERQDHWLRYYEWLRAEVEDRPMFGQEADGPSLQDIFVPLRCTWRDRPRERRGHVEHENGDKRTTVHVRWLLEELQAWLDKADKRDVLRVVTGGPGCGKSSTAKVFARDVGRGDRYNVFLVPLQGLDVSRDIDDIVSDYLDDARHNTSCLPESPINWIRHDPKPLLLMFDGLDEVAREDGAGLEVTRQFLESLRVWLGRVNDGADLKVMAVALGRPQAAEEAASKIGGLDGCSLLYAEQLCALDDERLKRGRQEEIVVDDPEGLADADHRRRFWDGYALFDLRYRDVEPEVLGEVGLNDLTVEPLLLYLLMYSGLAGKDWPEAKENRNRIYEAIFTEVHERDRREKSGLAVEDREDFFTLMECLGLAAWLGGGRTGSDEDFEHIRDEIYAPDRQKVFKSLDRARLKNVAVQFYTHHGSREQPGYAFIHKSFGEYLTARALIKASEIWCEEYGRRNKWGNFAEDWLRLAGGQRITPEILTFMIDEARLYAKPSSEDEPDEERAKSLVMQLCEVASLTLSDGFPAHRILPVSKGEGDWRRREIFQRNAEMSLYSAIHAWADVGYPINLAGKDGFGDSWQPGPIKVAWPEHSTAPAAAIFPRLLDQWDNGILTGKVFARWDFSDQLLEAAKLRGADLRMANLSGANLWTANAIEVSLQGADLRRTRLDHADLRGANLCKATLIGANLSAADLGMADLSNTDLSNAKLFAADLSDADLSGANLSRADLRNADLSDATLNRADLRGAVLHMATLTPSTPDNFWSAVNLTQEQIDKAYGNSETKLPDGLQRPAHWSDDD